MIDPAYDGAALTEMLAQEQPVHPTVDSVAILFRVETDRRLSFIEAFPNREAIDAFHLPPAEYAIYASAGRTNDYGVKPRLEFEPLLVGDVKPVEPKRSKPKKFKALT